MVTAEVTDVQQLTTRSKAKTTEWEAQEAIWKQATEWVQQANEQNVANLREHIKPSGALVVTTDEDMTWQALQDCQIILPLG